MKLVTRLYRTFLLYKAEFFLIGVIWYWLGCFVGMAIDYNHMTKDIIIDFQDELIKGNKTSNNYKVSYEIQQFLNDLEKRDILIDISTVKFGYIKDQTKETMDTFGSCYWKPYKKHNVVKIKINEAIINDPIALKTTVYHELGHCILHLDHNDKISEKNGVKIPQTIMHPTNLNDEYVYNNMDIFMDSMINDYIINRDNLITTIPQFVKSSLKHALLHPFYEVKVIAKNVLVMKQFHEMSSKYIIFNLLQLMFSLMIEISFATVIVKWIISPILDEFI